MADEPRVWVCGRSWSTAVFHRIPKKCQKGTYSVYNFLRSAYSHQRVCTSLTSGLPRGSRDGVLSGIPPFPPLRDCAGLHAMRRAYRNVYVLKAVSAIATRSHVAAAPQVGGEL
eukprot:1764958-Prymnesium_polylepis.1